MKTQFKVGDYVLSSIELCSETKFINHITKVTKKYYHYTAIKVLDKLWKDTATRKGVQNIQDFEDRSVLLLDEQKAELL